MKKRVLAWILLTAIVVSILPTMTFAAVDDAYGIKMTGVTREDGTGLTLTLAIKGPSVSYDSGQASVGIKIDSTKLRLVRTNGNPTNISTTSFASATAAGNNLDPEQNYLSNVGVLAKEDTTKNIIYIAYQPTFNGTVDLTDYTDLMSIRLEYQNGSTENDLDKSSIQLITVEESYMLGQNNIAYISTATDENGMQYGINDRGSGEENLAAPEIVYPNSDVINLNGVKVDAANKFVNVPVLLPEAGADVTVQASAKGYYTSDCADGTEIESGVTYKYSVSMKDASELPETVSIDENTGLMTVKAGAPAGVVTVVATGTYTNDKGHTSTKSGTYDVELCHGDAGDKNEKDPEPDVPKKDPGGDPDPAEKIVSGVEIQKDNVKVTSSLATDLPYEFAVARPASGQPAVEVSFTATDLDQFGDTMDTNAGSWNTPAVGNVTFENGTVTVPDSAADAESVAYTYTSSGYSATVELTISDTAITWPTLTNGTVFYGQGTESLTYAEDGGVTGQGVITNVTFSWKADQSLTVATTQAVMVCNYSLDGTEKSTEHNYPITVKKADQKIVIDPSIQLEGDGTVKTLEIPLDETIDLNTIVENISVQDESGKNLYSDTTVTYSLTNNEGGLVNMTNDEITGLKQSASGTDVANLTISASGTDNYNAAEDVQLELYVTKPVLKASITFDTTAPVYNAPITATVTEHANQNGSLTTDVTYQWGHVTVDGESGKITDFKAIGSAEDVTNLVPNGDGTATVTYTPSLTDVGKTLGLKVITPTDKEGYGWIHSVQAAMAAPVSKATWGSFTGSVKSVTTTSVTVTGETNAQFAIALKNAPAVAAEDGEEVTSDGHNWVASENGADVVFTTDDAGNALTANTEYTVFMKKTAEGYEDSAVTTFDAKTAKIKLTGDDKDPEGATVTVTAAIDETAGLKYGNTLTASVEVTDTNTENPVTIAADAWEYQWKRGTTEADAEVIEGAAGSTYTLVQEDIGKKIFVVATTNDACIYEAVAAAETTDVIAKADGPEFTNTLGVEKASKADAADGAITGLTSETAYEYLVKPVKGEGATEEPTPDWTTATKVTADTDGKITGLGVNTYLVRIPATDTHEASAYQEVTVTSLGYSITGVVVSYNAKNAVTYELYAWDDETGAYSETAAYTGTAVEAAETTTASKQTQDFKIEGIADGKYKLLIKKVTHLTYTVVGVTVNGADVDLTADSYPDAVKSIALAAGDVDGNGAVNVTDAGRVTYPTNYNATDLSTVPNPEADIDGNGAINVTDRGIITHPDNYNKQVSDFVIEL